MIAILNLALYKCNIINIVIIIIIIIIVITNIIIIITIVIIIIIVIIITVVAIIIISIISITIILLALSILWSRRCTQHKSIVASIQSNLMKYQLIWAVKMTKRCGIPDIHPLAPVIMVVAYDLRPKRYRTNSNLNAGLVLNILSHT